MFVWVIATNGSRWCGLGWMYSSSGGNLLGAVPLTDGIVFGVEESTTICEAKSAGSDSRLDGSVVRAEGSIRGCDSSRLRARDCECDWVGRGVEHSGRQPLPPPACTHAQKGGGANRLQAVGRRREPERSAGDPSADRPSVGPPAFTAAGPEARPELATYGKRVTAWLRPASRPKSRRHKAGQAGKRRRSAAAEEWSGA